MENRKERVWLHSAQKQMSESLLVGVLLSYCGKPDLDRDRLAHQLERILSGQLSGWIPPAT